jgi:ketosteroid isomerase-like protein
MSERSVEIVRGIYDRWGEGDFRTPFDRMDENVVFIMPPDLPDPGTYFGRDALAGYTRDFLAPWSKIMIEAEEIIPAGDSVVVAIRQHGEGDASGAETEFRYFHLWTFRGGKAIRLECIRDRAEALEAAGLSDG